MENTARKLNLDMPEKACFAFKFPCNLLFVFLPRSTPGQYQRPSHFVLALYSPTPPLQDSLKTFSILTVDLPGLAEIESDPMDS